MQKNILIDLDGVLNKYDGNYSEVIPEIKNGAKKFLKQLSKKYRVVIFTSRNILKVTKWLIEHKLDTYISDVTNVKLPAHLYIDDRCICFEGNYEEIINQIEEFKVYWK